MGEGLGGVLGANRGCGPTLFVAVPILTELAIVIWFNGQHFFHAWWEVAAGCEGLRYLFPKQSLHASSCNNRIHHVAPFRKQT